MTTRTLNVKPSMGSMTANTEMGTAATSGNNGRQGFRPCADCTCTPGLLWRQGRRTSQFLRKMSNSRRSTSQGGSRASSSESIYSSDTIWQTKVVNTDGRLLELRKLMAKNELCCYIVPSEDEHQSEYVSEADQRRAFISGFTGSAGVACITRNLLNFNEESPDGKAVLSTDGRYFLQATQQLDSNWTLLRQDEDQLTWNQWCVNEAFEMSMSLGGKPAKIGIDPKLVTYTSVLEFQKLIKEKTADTEAVVEFIPLEENLIDSIWYNVESKPERHFSNLLLLDYRYSGETFTSKRERLMKHIREKNSGSDSLCIVALDEICWLLNLRGSDIAYNPVFYAYLLLQGDVTTLFCNNPISDEITNYFKENNIAVKPYKEIWDVLKTVAAEFVEKNQTMLLPSTSSWELIRAMGSANYVLVQAPVEVLKVVKNKFEIENARAAQVKEAVCLVQYFSWLEQQLVEKEKLIDEYSAAKKLLEIRKTQSTFMGNAFQTISSSGANAATIHYAAPEDGSAMICPYKVYLCDSGSQFMEGTTDITRTLHMKEPTQEEIDMYTLVLKGNLALERAVFPEGTAGHIIDVFARQFLWQYGLDYRHGTGHGVGSFLNVHEGPIGFSVATSRIPLEAGNIITNEPGFYKDGEFGIRIENEMLVTEADGLKFGKKKFLKFENITLVPYCRKLINCRMLTSEEKKQINVYYHKIWRTVVPFLQPQSIAYQWLKRETAPL
ncbi:HGL030Cp [Eremothecium sinecaudum]|uniref:Xaa-Pro aminopeptidase n=1 Tax=Eremothecium sinecaudum TaxID=45286 RepID=A0A0X8HVS8_9SACH|nr:HGL030Cp [Eremothecium sinecaudum]AMD22310.1 HGL030Cp [Eremothecium sinecaudum]